MPVEVDRRLNRLVAQMVGDHGQEHAALDQPGRGGMPQVVDTGPQNLYRRVGDRLTVLIDRGPGPVYRRCPDPANEPVRAHGATYPVGEQELVAVVELVFDSG